METIEVFKKEEFRKWLAKNHKKESKVAVILHKRHTGKPAPTHRELMEEAICFGWIDTTIKRVDEDTFIRHFSKRTLNSRWSNNTIRYGKQLIKEGRMAAEGLKFFKLGLSKPTFDSGIPKNPDMPEDLKAALAKLKSLEKKFEELVTPSAKRTFYRWILYAKTPVTRTKRIKHIIDSLKKGKTKLF